MSLCSCPGGFRISIPNSSSTHIDIGVYMVTNNLALFWVFYIVSCKFQWHTFQYIKVLTWEGRKMSSSLIVEWRDKLIAFWKENIQCTVYIAAHFRSMQNFWHLKISFLQLITVNFAMVIAQLVTFAMVQLKNGAFVAITAQIGEMLQWYP